MKTQKGFTLIELLVVIAIIGILSSVVLASLNTARAKGADAAIKSNLANIRAQAEIIYDNNTPNTYLGLCTNTTVAAQTLGAANALGGTVDNALGNIGASTKVSCHIDAANLNWAISSGLKKTGGTYYQCVDSTGKSIETTTVLAASGVVCL